MSEIEALEIRFGVWYWNETCSCLCLWITLWMWRGSKNVKFSAFSEFPRIHTLGLWGQGIDKNTSFISISHSKAVEDDHLLIGEGFLMLDLRVSDLRFGVWQWKETCSCSCLHLSNQLCEFGENLRLLNLWPKKTTKTLTLFFFLCVKCLTFSNFLHSHTVS